MSAKSFNGNNNLLLKIGEKLYLNSMTADVNLVVTIGDDHSVYVPAHKIILSAASPVFELMFNGPMKNELDVQMADTSLDALTEFLQFFYGSNVILTLENIFTVTNLCNRYQVADGLALCEKALQKMLTINNMSKGYELALRLELGKVVKFCGQKIKQNPEGVMKSTEFLECTQETLGEILKLVLPKCSSSVVVNACMAWAKTKCERKNVEATATNMKDEFGSVLDEIPFAGLLKDEFAQFIETYKGLLSDTDLQTIILNVMKRNEKTTKDDRLSQTKPSQYSK